MNKRIISFSLKVSKKGLILILHQKEKEVKFNLLLLCFITYVMKPLKIDC